MKKHREWLEIILTTDLYHTLGADRIALNEIEKLKSYYVQNDIFSEHIYFGLKRFYLLENVKYRVKNTNNIGNSSHKEEKPSNDIMINKRLNTYSGLIKRLDRASLSLFEPKYSHLDKKAESIHKRCEAYENQFLFACYTCVIKSIEKVDKAFSKINSTNAKKLNQSIKLKLERFFNRNYIPEEEINDFKNEIAAKLSRFKSDERCAYWENEVKKPYLSEKLNITDLKNRVSDYFSKPSAVSNPFMGKLLCLFLLKYHIISHKISEGKQYSLFHDGKDDYSLINSYVSYKKELERCRMIFTFVRFISKYYPEFYNPFGGEGIAHLFQALAYFRRGNIYFLQENNEKAFNDYNYAQYFLKGKRQFKKVTYKPMVQMFSVVLEAISLGAKGECYRQDYDYENAYEYFCQAVILMQEIPNIIENDKKNYRKFKRQFSKFPTREEWNDLIVYGLRYNIHIINKAKMFMVKGDFRRAFKWYCRCLLNFFNLYKRIKCGENILAIPGHKILIQSFGSIISYLEQTKNDAIIIKTVLNEHCNILTDKLENFLRLNGEDMLKSCLLVGLMSDIYNRISMLLYIFALPGKKHPSIHMLSQKWHGFSVRFNKYNGLSRYNQLIYSILQNGPGPFSISNDQLDNIPFSLLKHDGSIFDQYNRHFATWTLLNIFKNQTKSEKIGKNDYKRIIANLMSHMFQYTENFSLKNRELFKYLTRERTISKNQNSITKLLILRRWSSYTPSIPRPSAFYHRGGGFFIVHRGKGIAIDPGFDFILNLYQEGFSVNDIDAVIITHDHIDHHSDFDALLTFWHLNNTMGYGGRPKELFLSTGLVMRYNFLLRQTEDYHIYPMKDGCNVTPIDSESLYKIRVIRAIHQDLSTNKTNYSVGFILRLKMTDNSFFDIGYTGDTEYDDKIIKSYINCDIVLFNISSLPYREMKFFLGNTNISDDDEYKKKLEGMLNRFEQKKPIPDDLSKIANQFYYAYWHLDKDQKYVDKVFSNSDSFNEYSKMELGEHLYLQGLLKFNEKIIKQKNRSKPQMVIITELKEEIGSFRNKIADEINQYNENPDELKYLTGDIGMTVALNPDSAINLDNNKLNRLQICCSRCKLNNDYLPEDIFYPINKIGDFCIKGEDEGIFYLCKRHDYPKVNSTSNISSIDFSKEIFYQKIERYNVFGKK